MAEPGEKFSNPSIENVSSSLIRLYQPVLSHTNTSFFKLVSWIRANDFVTMTRTLSAVVPLLHALGMTLPRSFHRQSNGSTFGFV